MRSRIFTAPWLVAALALAGPASAGTESAEPLTAKQQEVLENLQANWGVDLDVSSIAKAMERVGGTYTDDDRYALATYVRDHPELHQVLRRFGWITVALDPTEKVTGLLVSKAERDELPPPGLEEIAAITGTTPEAVASGLEMMERLDLVKRDAEAGELGYRMAKKRYTYWQGAFKIDFTAHQVHLHGVKDFETY